MDIEFESEGFGSGGPVSNGTATLTTSWSEVLWAAITVGRPNVGYVFAHGASSMYEAIFRWSLVRMTLEQSGPRASRFRRTAAARALDPSEKGAVNYFLGLTMGKLFAAKLLGAPWVVHLDVFRAQLNAVLTGRSRPDLIGQTTGGDWVALECKGRVSPPNADAKEKAKEQAQRITSVNGIPPSYSIGAITYFAKDTLRFYWRDPDPARPKSFTVEMLPQDWSWYYAPALGALRAHPGKLASLLDGPRLVVIEGADIQLGIHPTVLQHLLHEQWDEARTAAHALEDQPVVEGIPYQPDGIAVVAGESWSNPFSGRGERG